MKTIFKSAVDKIQAPDELKRKTSEYLIDNISAISATVNHKRNISVIRRWAIVATCAIALIGAYAFYKTPTSYVSLDINPSVELGVNVFDSVVTVKACNNDGKTILKGQNVVGSDVKNSISTLVKSAAKKGFVAKDGSTVISITAESDNNITATALEDDAAKGAGSAVKSEGVKASIENDKITLISRNEAQKLNISPGKLNLIQKLQKLDPAITVNQYRNAKVTDIMKKYKELVAKEIAGIKVDDSSSILSSATSIPPVTSSENSSIAGVSSQISKKPFSLNKQKITLKEGSSYCFKTAVPSGKTIVWASSDTSVATITNGIITAVNAGCCKITATLSDDESAVCTVTVENATGADKIRLSKQKVILAIGGSCIISAKITPKTTLNQALTWISSDTNVATVTDGKIVAVGVGTCTITASTSTGISTVCAVTVKSAAGVGRIRLSKLKISLAIGGSYLIKAKIAPKAAANQVLAWISSDTNVATVTDGKIVAVGVGTCTITASTSTGISAVCTVTVKNAAGVGRIRLSKQKISLAIGGSCLIKAKFTPKAAANQVLTWTSSNTDVATVTDGKIVAVGAGTCTITVSTSTGISAVCTVTVKSAAGVDKIHLSKQKVSLAVGGSCLIKAKFTPKAAAYQVLTWASSNTDVATVTDGKIVAVGAGTCTITVSASTGISAVCTVTVKSAADAYKIRLSKQKVSLAIGGSCLIKAKFTPKAAANQALTWTSSNTDVATVTDGKIFATGAGTCTITVSTSNGTSSACTVTVKGAVVNAGSVRLSQKNAILAVNGTITLTATIKPDKATDKTVIWTSSDPRIATVDANGFVTAVAAGRCTITAAASNGKAASCTIKVRPATGQYRVSTH